MSPMSPGNIRLKIGNKVQNKDCPNSIAPGSSFAVSFKCRVIESGLVELEASIKASDDIIEDDKSCRMILVEKMIPVLLSKEVLIGEKKASAVHLLSWRSHRMPSLTKQTFRCKSDSGNFN